VRELSPCEGILVQTKTPCTDVFGIHNWSQERFALFAEDEVRVYLWGMGGKCRNRIPKTQAIDRRNITPHPILYQDDRNIHMSIKMWRDPNRVMPNQNQSCLTQLGT
jgi:hypothetical protein